MGRVGLMRGRIGAGSRTGDVTSSIVFGDSGLRGLMDAGVPVEEAIAKIAFDAAAAAALNIRAVGAIDTSYMVNTTQARRLGPLLWSVGTAAYYGVYVELGTVSMPARPWLHPAMEEAKRNLPPALGGALRQAAS